MSVNVIVFSLLAFCASYVVANEKTVFCYYGTWATYRWGLGKFDVENVNPNLCSHLIYTFVGITSQGNVVSLDSYLDLPSGRDNFRKFNALKQKNPNLKTILAVGGWNEGSAKYSIMAASPTLRRNFITSASQMVRNYGFDGFDLDWEYPNQRDTVYGPADKANFNQLLKELREEFDNYGLLLTAAVSAVKDSASRSYDIPTISKYLDYISLMAYDMYGAWDPVTGHNAPLHRGEGDEHAVRDDLHTVDVAVEYWLQQGCPREKLAVGLPLYGRTFTLTNPNVNSLRAPSSGAGISGPYTATSGSVGYNEFCHMLKTESWDIKYDSLAKVPYAVQGRNWVSYDDPDSITTKVEYALANNLAGVMVWSIETDDFHGICSGEDYPILRAINRALERKLESGIESTTTTPPSITASTTATSTTTSPTTASPTSTTVSTSTTESQPTQEPTQPGAICKAEGFAANPEDCSSFYACVLGANGILKAQKLVCPPNLHWDEYNEYCNYPEQARCSV